MIPIVIKNINNLTSKTDNNLSEQQIKNLVKASYSDIAKSGNPFNNFCGCSTGGCSVAKPMTDIGGKIIEAVEKAQGAEGYHNKEGYMEDADLGLGCGIPSDFAEMKEGETVVDLGSGAGIDCFIARKEVGESGHVIGIDMTEEMLKKAWLNCDKRKYKNVEFRLGEIENIPVLDGTVDLTISNCVINLSPNKKQVFQDIYRILKEGGRFCISDVVVTNTLPEVIQKAAVFYAGCVAGAALKNDYLKMIEDSGFKRVDIKKESEIEIPVEILEAIGAKKSEIEKLEKKEIQILSITILAWK